MTNRPTTTELGHLLESTTLSTYRLLCRAVDVYDGHHGIVTRQLLQLAIHDWLTEADVLKPEDRLRLILVLEDHLQAFADAFDRDEREDTSSRPVTALAITDWRYARLVPPLAGRPVWSFDLLTDAWVDAPAECPLTTLACDLSVLLLRLLGKMNKARRQQAQTESTDAASPPPERTGR